MAREIVCICGSTRFWQSINDADLHETLAGRIVLSVAGGAGDEQIFAGIGHVELGRIRANLDALHREKIAMADSVLIVNVDDYLGESTRSELEFARGLGKPIRWWVWPTRHGLSGDTAARGGHA